MEKVLAGGWVRMSKKCKKKGKDWPQFNPFSPHQPAKLISYFVYYRHSTLIVITDKVVGGII